MRARSLTKCSSRISRTKRIKPTRRSAGLSPLPMKRRTKLSIPGMWRWGSSESKSGVPYGVPQIMAKSKNRFFSDWNIETNGLGWGCSGSENLQFGWERKMFGGWGGLPRDFFGEMVGHFQGNIQWQGLEFYGSLLERDMTWCPSRHPRNERGWDNWALATVTIDSVYQRMISMTDYPPCQRLPPVCQLKIRVSSTTVADTLNARFMMSWCLRVCSSVVVWAEKSPSYHIVPLSKRFIVLGENGKARDG